MDQLINKDQRTVKRNYWLINLRWIAIGGLSVMIILSFALLLKVQFFGLILVFSGLIIHNLISRYLLYRGVKSERKDLVRYIERIMFYQIVIDIIILTVLIHFSGGFETPFLLFYTFHVVIASILLSKKISYIVASLEVFMITSLASLEYFHLIPHHSLGFIDYTSSNPIFSLSVILIFIITSYVLVYLVSNISIKLKKQEETLFSINKKLETVNAELERKDLIKDEYVSRITHDIKGHLAAIQTNLSVLHKQIAGPIDEKQLKFVNLAYKRTLKLTAFTQDLLRITELRKNNRTEKEHTQLNNTIQDTIESVKANADNKSITIKSNLDDNLQAYCNKFSIEEVISNLLLNAIKYTHENGLITVYAKTKGEYTEVIIEDNGIGIPKSELNNIFDDFFRATNAKNNRIEGTGLGLSLVWQIIERNNGKIWAESEENKGTKFIFTIPTKEIIS